MSPTSLEQATLLIKEFNAAVAVATKELDQILKYADDTESHIDDTTFSDALHHLSKVASTVPSSSVRAFRAFNYEKMNRARRVESLKQTLSLV